MNKWTKTWLYFLILSLMSHILIVYSDQIKHMWDRFNFEFSEEEQKEIHVVEQNIKKVDKTIHSNQSKKILQEYFEKEKDKLISEFINKGKIAQNKENNKKILSEIAPDLKNFTSYSDKKEKTYKVLLSSRGNNHEKEKEEEKEEESCDDFFVGIGIKMESTLRDGRPEYYEVVEVAKGYAGETSDVLVGDVFLGMKDESGVFWEGNKLLTKKQHSIGENVETLFLRNGKVLNKKISLTKICYNKK